LSQKLRTSHHIESCVDGGDSGINVAGLEGLFKALEVKVGIDGNQGRDFRLVFEVPWL
jgi:hypothetical protein